ncbi:MAG: pyruvate-formate lyase, partial [Clostridia bacterium]|nr:pyruvate-formate lyase [Clostridia bacterium]
VSLENGGIEIIEKFILAHFAQGGTLININVLDGDTLAKANDNPELYPDLVVRVTGFTAYFATLSPQFRQLVVDRFLHGV